MNDGKLKNLIAEAVSLDREIRDMERKLKEMKKALIAEAESRPDEQIPTDGGGASWNMVGGDGCAVSVSFPAPSLRSRIDGVGKTIEKVMQAAGKAFYDLFEQLPSWRPVPEFRDKAEKLLGKDARKLIKLCETESSPRVNFETKEAEVEA